MDLSPYIKDGFLRVQVRVGARKTQVQKIENQVVYLEVNAPAQDGKANAEIERYLSKVLQMPVHITAGKTSKRKRLRVGK